MNFLTLLQVYLKKIVTLRKCFFLQNIVYRENNYEILKCVELLTVTYKTTVLLFW